MSDAIRNFGGNNGPCRPPVSDTQSDTGRLNEGYLGNMRTAAAFSAQPPVERNGRLKIRLRSEQQPIPQWRRRRWLAPGLGQRFHRARQGQYATANPGDWPGYDIGILLTARADEPRCRTIQHQRIVLPRMELRRTDRTATMLGAIGTVLLKTGAFVQRCDDDVHPIRRKLGRPRHE